MVQLAFTIVTGARVVMQSSLTLLITNYFLSFIHSIHSFVVCETIKNAALVQNCTLASRPPGIIGVAGCLCQSFHCMPSK